MKSRSLLSLFLIIYFTVLPTHAQDAMPTPLPALEPITAANAVQVQPLHRFGYGVVKAVGWSPDGNTLGVGTTVGLLLYNSTKWSEENGTDTESIPRILEGQSGVYSLDFSPDSKTIASGGGDGSVIQWDIATGENRAMFQLETTPVDGMRFSRSGRLLVATDDSLSLRVWDLKTQSERTRVEEHGIWGQPRLQPSLSFNADESMLAVGWGGIMQVFDLASGKEMFKDLSFCDDFDEFSADVSVAFVFNRDQLFYLGHCPYPNKGWFGTWNRGDTTATRDVIPNDYVPTPLRLDTAPDGHVIRYSTEGAFMEVSLVVENYAQNMRVSDSEYVAVDSPFAWSNQKGLLAGLDVISQKTRIYVGNWGADAEINAASLEGFYSHAPGFAFGPDRTILPEKNYGHYTVMDAVTGADRFPVDGFLSLPSTSPYSPDGRMLASAGQIEIGNTYHQVIHILDAKTGAEQKALEADAGRLAVAWSPDSRLLVSANQNGTLTLYDVASGQVLAVLKGHNLAVTAVAFSQDGSLIASSSDDGTVRVWGIPP